jgi:hypothetical protein
MFTSLRTTIKEAWGWDAVGVSLIVVVSYAVIFCCILLFALTY